jgi:hypothetical protein
MSQIGLFADGRTVTRVPIARAAMISPCGLYRYRLWRQWEPAAGSVLWIMLNPSIADAVLDDATIRRCMSFAVTWGYGGIVVVNLFALRSTSPLLLYGHPDPIGPENDAEILRAVTGATRILAAWGQHGGYVNRGATVARIVAASGRSLECLGITKDGQPKHPVRVSGDLQPVPYKGAAPDRRRSGA